MEGFQINYTDLSDLFWEYKRKIENLIENIDNCIERINMFTENAVFTGKTGDAVKSYLGEAHITILSGIKVTAQTLLDNMAAYKDGYRAIDSSTNFKLDEEAIQEFRKKLASNYEDTDEHTGKIRSVLSEVSDISDVGMPDSNGVFDIHEQMDSDLIKLVSNVNSYERENVVRLENSVELLLENLQSCLSKIGLSQGAIESYETGSFITGKDAGALNTGIKIFGDLHEKNKEAYDEIYETEQKIKDEAEKRKTQGIWRTVGGAVLIATGAACIVLTGGAATPIVADVAVAVGSGTAVFGAADAIEGTQDIYYGSTGDIDSTAVNGIKDDLFQGNEDAYYLTENAFAFAASAMIPIGQASTAGNLTFKSTATIVAKEGISMGAGAGAQKLTTDVTGNDTAGMVAGMVASGVTAKGLNGIEAEANKLAKAPKGIDGAAKGVENLAEDVISESGVNIRGAGDESGSNTFGNYSTKIDSKVTVVEKQELPSWLIDTYKDGVYRTVVTNEDITVYRSFGYNAEAGGAFATSSPAVNRIKTKVDSAILPEWKNILRYEAEIVIPKGTTLNIGHVGEQFTMSGTVLDVILAEFDKLGYKTVYGVLDAVNYGVPQFRERFVLIGSRDNEDIFLPIPTHFQMHQSKEYQWQTVRSVIEDLESDHGECATLSEERLKFLKMVPEYALIPDR